MKITGPDNLQQPQPGSTHSPKGTDQASGFRDMLRETIDQPGPTSAAQKASPLPEPRAIHNAGQQLLQPASLTESASKAIDMLDSYSKALANPGKTLRDIEPELKAFVHQTESLYEEYLDSGQDDPMLKSVMDELLRTARLEDVRFQRGDYLDTE